MPNSRPSAASLIKDFPVLHLAAIVLAVVVMMLVLLLSGRDDSRAHALVAVSEEGGPSSSLLDTDVTASTDEDELFDTLTIQFDGAIPSFEASPTLLNRLPIPAVPYRHLFRGRSIAHADVPYSLPSVSAARVRYDIKPGDTLSGIFADMGLPTSLVYQLLAADEELLALDILRPGNHLVFHRTFNPESLISMELYIHPGHQVVYHRVAEDGFEPEERINKGEWRQETLAGQVYGSFYNSARQAGLTDGEIVTVGKLLEERLDFRRQLRAGDHFQVVRNSQYVEGVPTGQNRIEAIRIQQRNRVHTAFLHTDGMYYDADGESLTRAFRRHPFDGNYRLSSHFNPTRRHPVTRRVSPHNGTDFAMPIGTPVVSIGDGVVTRVENHPFAGKYIEIQHGPRYKTRYLHLHRQSVRRGQSVKRGQRIGLSGNTGRTTGPHLHFEVHENNRPVNAMRVQLPMVASIPSKDKPEFKRNVSDYLAKLDRQRDVHIAMVENRSRD